MEQRPTTDNVTPTPVAAPSTPDPSLHAQSNVPPPPTDPIQPAPETPTSSEKPRKKPRSYALKSVLSTVQLVVGAILLAFVINHFVFQSYQVFGQSMIPTLHEGDRLIINKLGKSWSSVFGDGFVPRRGDIIVFHNPNEADIQLVKRVIGLPGDRVVVEDGNLTVFAPESPQGFDFDEYYGLDVGSTVGQVDTQVPAGEIFVVGDNRSPGGSLDSRNELGTVPLDQVVGDLAFRIFPFDTARSF